MIARKEATGTAVGGKVVVEGETFAEGETVTLLLRENYETFELTREEEDEILESIDALQTIVFRRGTGCVAAIANRLCRLMVR